MLNPFPFPTVVKLADECGCSWKGYQIAANETKKAEQKLAKALASIRRPGKSIDSDSSLVLFGSLARYEMLSGSDYDWSLLVDGVVNTNHAKQAGDIAKAIERAKLEAPGSTGTFGNLIFSHNLVHCIGGMEDSNVNLTLRMLMLLESRCFVLADQQPSLVWRNVVSNILERYFEEDVHFSPKGSRRVPRFLLNDLTRYWRTICVDYAAKHQKQDGKGWALRNAKIRLSRKLLYAAGLAFCLHCELEDPAHENTSAAWFVESALDFARTPPLEYLAGFVETFVKSDKKRKRISREIFGAYNQWLLLLNDGTVRNSLKKLDHGDAAKNSQFQKIRDYGSTFASGLRELYFNRDKDSNKIANLSLDYVGF